MFVDFHARCPGAGIMSVAGHLGSDMDTDHFAHDIYSMYEFRNWLNVHL